MRYSLGTRVTVFFVASIVVVAAASTYFFISSTKVAMQRELLERGTILAEALSKAIDEGMATEDLDFIKEFSDIVHTKEVTLAQVYSTLWLPLYSQPPSMLEDASSPWARDHFTKSLDYYSPYYETSDKYLDLYMPVYYHGLDMTNVSPQDLKRYHIGFVRLKLSTDHVKAATADATRNSVLVSATLTVFVLLMINGYIRRKVIKPVMALHDSVLRYQQGELPVEVDGAAPRDEIGMLSVEFNHMSRAIRDREQRLAEEKERLNVTLRSIGDGVITTDTRGRVTLLNHEAEVMTGTTSADAYGRPLEEVFDIINERTLQKCENPVEKVLRTGAIIELANHTMLISKDGTRRIITDSGAPIKDASGTTLGVVLVFRDNTAKTRMEEALKESETKFRGFAEQSLTAVYLVQDDVFKYVNPHFAVIFGYPLEECIGMPFVQIVHPDDIELVKAMVARRIYGETPTVRYEFRGQKKDGETIDIEVFGAAATFDGRPAAIGTLLDITARKRDENRLRASLSEKEVLLAEVHHRVKNNLTIIYSLLQLQARQIIDPEVLSMFKVSQGRIRSLALVHEKLYRSPNMAEIDLADYVDSLVHEIVASFHHQPKDVSVKVDVGAFSLGLDQLIPCGLIINELVSNAMKYAFGLTESPEISVSFHKDADGLCTLVLKDNGVGLPDSFEIGRSKSLGLQIVNTLTEQLGGTLRIERDGGAAFFVSFRFEKHSPEA